MKMDHFAAAVLTFLYLQALCSVGGASLPAKHLVNTTAGVVVGQNRSSGLEGVASSKYVEVTYPMPTLVTCVAGFTNRSDEVYGIYANISLWGHEHTKRNAYSAAAIQVSNDRGAEFNAIRAGFHTLPSLYNDTKLHLFVQWTADDDWTTGCYNMDCPGFVPTQHPDPETTMPGMAIDELSSYNETDSSMTLLLFKDDRVSMGGGDWWLYKGVGHVRYLIGRWPASLFTTMSRLGTEAAWYGAVGFWARDETPPAMGSGHGPGEGRTRAAYFADIGVMDNRGAFVEPSRLDRVAPMASAAGCYPVAMDAGGANTFFYGGPVVNTNCV